MRDHQFTAAEIAAAVDDIDAPISSVCVVASLGGTIGRLIISIHKCTCSDDHPDVGLPSGVAVSVWSRARDYEQTIRVTPTLEAEVSTAAWQAGAWDICRVAYGPGYDGALPSSLADFCEILRDEGWVSWTYRPMMLSPEIRQKANAGKDKSLIPIMLGRSGPPPDIAWPVIMPGRSHVVRMGVSSETPDPKGRRATPRQRAYIVALRRGTSEQGKPLPASLTCAEASLMIEALIAMRGAA